MRTRLVACLALLVSSLAAPAFAADGLLETLKEKKVLRADEYDRLKAQQTPTAAPDTPGNGGPLRTSDGPYTLRIGTLQQLDFAAYADDRADLSDGSAMRRSRLSIAGVFLNDFQYRVEYDFAGTTKLTDAYVAYTALQPFTVTVGQFKQPFGMEALSSDKATTFMERGLSSSLITTRAPGLMVTSAGPHWSANAGVFGEPVDHSTSGDEGYGLVGRVTYAPWLAHQRVLHLGVGVSYRSPTRNNSRNADGSTFSTIRFSSKPESNVLTQRSVDTGEIVNVDHYLMGGIEAAAQIGTASIQAEYQLMQITRGSATHLIFSGWYTQLAYTLTGEARPYAPSRGLFNVIEPTRNFGRDGWGAFEIAARISDIDLNSDDIGGGQQRNATFGVNWYLNPVLRISGNLVKVLRVSGGPFAGDTPAIFQTRLQLVF